jgi:hypothetical protein
MNGVLIPIDAVTFKKSATGEWELFNKNVSVAHVGNYGEAPDTNTAKVLKLSDKLIAFLIDDKGKSEGHNDIISGEQWNDWQEVIIFSASNGWNYGGLVYLNSNNDGFCDENEDSMSIYKDVKCWGFKGELGIVPLENQEYPALLVTKQGTEADEKLNVTVAKNDLYVFKNGKYEYVKPKVTSSVVSKPPVVQEAKGKITTFAKNSDERKFLMDILRVPVQRELHVPIQFVVQELRVLDNWAFLTAEPIRKDGKEIDYTKTKYRVAYEEGAFDSQMNAIFKKTNNQWELLGYQIGATDVAYACWWKEYHAPKNLMPYSEECQ